MENFGNSILSTSTLLDGKLLSYSLNNQDISDLLRSLINEFQVRFARFLNTTSMYLENKDSFCSSSYKDYEFLKLCSNNLENIINDNYDWYTDWRTKLP